MDDHRYAEREEDAVVPGLWRPLYKVSDGSEDAGERVERVAGHGDDHAAHEEEAPDRPAAM